MELVFPLALYVGIPAIIILIFVGLKRKDAFRDGKKVANTDFLEETELYKHLKRKYKCFSILALVGLWLALLLSVIMLARPARIDQIHPQVHNRDIFICMDVSTSSDEINLNICKELKEVVRELNGERFGISIFIGQSVLLVPLTTDYDYVMESLDKLEASFKTTFYLDHIALYDKQRDLYYYRFEGTINENGGSSLIGDGLASCLYSFPDLKENEERSRLIIFTTDNELEGEPIVTVEEAAALCKKNDVKVFAVTPENIVDREVFRNAINSTGGKFYEFSSPKVFKELIEDIRLTDASVTEDVKTIVTDKPEALFIWLLICISIHFLFSRKVKL
ncbi:MAG: VWA domain-containing protein [Lachnospiraceae bacterium]|nr:VWA domain-containing protein [Lachnospiraceae bacterium]